MHTIARPCAKNLRPTCSPTGYALISGRQRPVDLVRCGAGSTESPAEDRFRRAAGSGFRRGDQTVNRLAGYLPGGGSPSYTAMFSGTRAGQPDSTYMKKSADEYPEDEACGDTGDLWTRPRLDTVPATAHGQPGGLTGQGAPGGPAGGSGVGLARAAPPGGANPAVVMFQTLDKNRMAL